jgi:hypothetical protein
MTTIKEYKPFYVVYLKDWTTVEITEQKKNDLQEAMLKGYDFLPLGKDIYNKFQILCVKEKIPNDIDQFILSQPKSIRDKVNAYATENNIIWNSIDHVTNFITNNKD